jgi:hypothetical protein
MVVLSLHQLSQLGLWCGLALLFATGLQLQRNARSRAARTGWLTRQWGLFLALLSIAIAIAFGTKAQGLSDVIAYTFGLGFGTVAVLATMLGLTGWKLTLGLAILAVVPTIVIWMLTGR